MATAQGRISNQDDEHEFRRARFLRPKTEGIREIHRAHKRMHPPKFNEWRLRAMMGENL